MKIQTTTHTKQFIYSFVWNLFNSGTTQGLLIGHHFLLRTFIGIEFHAILGCLLSGFYFLLSISNLGLNASLAPHLQEYTKSKRSLKNFMLQQVVPQIIFIALCAAIFFLTYNKYINIISKPLAAIICITFIFESLKKIVKAFLQLNFFTRESAIIEVVGMYAYIATIWIGYLLGIKIDLIYCFGWLLVLSAIQTTLYLIYFWEFYNSRPDFHDTSDNNIVYIAKTRFFVWSNQLCTDLFSTNFLVPLSAIYIGLNQASSLKIISSISQWIVLITQNSFGLSSNALLANTKEENDQEKRKIFNFLNFMFNQLFVFLFIFIAINITKMPDNKSGLYFLILLILADCFSSLYQNVFIIKEKSNLIFGFNFLSLSSLAFLYYLGAFSSNISLFFVYLLIVRVILFCILASYSYYKWGLNPNFSVNRNIAIGAIVLSILFYIIS